MRPAISVLLPVRNAADSIDRAVASVVAQTWRDWELLAVDDGSADATAAHLAEWARRDPRIRVLNSSGRGLVAALETALGAARGELVARMDADDESAAFRLESQRAALHRDDSLGVVSARVAFGGEEKAQGYARYIAWLNELISPEQIRLNRFIESPLAHPSVMFRRSLIEQYGGYRSGDFPEDYELWLRWLDRGVRMAKCEQTLLVWHDPPSRLSRTDPRYRPEAFYQLKAEYVARELTRMNADRARAVWVWGAGRPTRRRAEFLCSHNVEISAYIDIDPRKVGGRAGGRPVLAPTSLPPPGAVVVLVYVGSLGARELIRTELNRRNYQEGVDYLVCA